MTDDQQFQITLQTKGRLTDVGEFEQIVVRANPDGSTVRVSDLGRVELGAKSADSFSRLDGGPTAAMGIYLAPGANAVAIAAGIKEAMETLKERFPDDLDYVVMYDTTDFVNASIEKVIHTLFEAFALVILVVFLFLGSWRATLIPLVAVPGGPGGHLRLPAHASASPPTPSPCSRWCSPSASWWTTPSWWWRRSST